MLRWKYIAMKQNSTTKYFSVRLSRLLVTLFVAVAGIFLLDKTVFAESLSEKISNLQTQIDQSQAEANRLSGEADTLQNALNILSAEKNALQAKLDLSQAEFDRLTIVIAENQQKLERQQKVLTETISELSVESTTSPIELLAGSNSIGDFIDRQEYRTSVQEQIEAAITTVQKLKTQLAQQKAEIEIVLAEQKVQRDQLAAKEAEQSALIASTRSQEAAYQSQVGDLQQQKASAEAALAASFRSRSYATAPAGYVATGAVVGSVGSSGMSTGPHLHLEARGNSGVTDPSPYIETEPINMPPGYVSQSYGNQDSMYIGGRHPGIDYAANFGAPIFAVSGGNMYRGCSQQLLGTWAYGYVAIVEQANGVRMLYAHMSGGPGC